MTVTSFTYFTDAGHGWLLIPSTQLAEVGLSASDISSCSYRRGETVALEHDCDMPIFLNAYVAATGNEPRLSSLYHETSPVRSWSSFGSASMERTMELLS